MWVTGVDHRVGSQACASWRERIVGVSLSPQVPKTADVLVSDSSYHHRQNTGLVLCLCGTDSISSIPIPQSQLELLPSSRQCFPIGSDELCCFLSFCCLLFVCPTAAKRQSSEGQSSAPPPLHTPSLVEVENTERDDALQFGVDGCCKHQGAAQASAVFPRSATDLVWTTRCPAVLSFRLRQGNRKGRCLGGCEDPHQCA